MDHPIDVAYLERMHPCTDIGTFKPSPTWEGAIETAKAHRADLPCESYVIAIERDGETVFGTFAPMFSPPIPCPGWAPRVTSASLGLGGRPGRLTRVYAVWADTTHQA